ncbi:MAG: signal transduction histidine kinase [Marivirga sp.]|jgi:signal transduction histidine kinase
MVNKLFSATLLNNLFFAMKYWLFIFFFLLYTALQGQPKSNGVDEIKSSLSRIPADSNRVLLLEQITNAYYNINIDSANYYAQKTLDLALAVGFKRGIALGYLRVGFARILLGDIAGAIPMHAKSIEMADSIEDYNISSRAYANLGRCMLDLGNNFKAIAYFKKAIEIRREIAAMDEMIAMLQTTIGEAYLASNNLTACKLYLDSALSANIVDYASVGRILNSTAAWYIEKEQYALADSTLQEAWETIKGQQDLLRKANNRYYFGLLKLAQEEIQEANRYGLEAKEYCQQLGSISVLGKVYELLAAVENKRGHPQQSLDYLQHSLAIRDSIQSSRSRSSALLFENHEQQKVKLIAQNKTDILEAEKDYQQILWLYSILFFSLLLGALLFYLLYKQRANKKLKKVNAAVEELNRDLVEREKELSAVNEELLQQQEEIVSQLEVIEDRNIKLEEANTIIKEQNEKIVDDNEKLDETVKERTNEIVAYNMQLEQFAFISSHNLRGPVARILGLGNVLRQSNAHDEREEIIKMLDTSTVELDTVIKDLNRILEVQKNNTAIFENVNLQEELLLVKGILKSEIEQTQCRVIEDFSVCNELYGIKSYINSILYNLLSNSIKYRKRREEPIVRIETSIEGNKVKLTVSDNGIGFDVEANKNNIFNLYKRFHDHVEGRGIGLYMVKTQVLALNGRITVESSKETGTTFTIVFTV